LMLRYLFRPPDALSTERLVGNSPKPAFKPRMTTGMFLDSTATLSAAILLWRRLP
jgi:hypothetical protein